MQPSPRVLSAPDGYRLWAPSYGAETAVSELDRQATERLTPDLSGRSLLDAGCGTGRRLREAATRGALGVGVDLVEAMLRRGRESTSPAPHVAAADVCALPFPAAAFDVVWCRLVIGHLADARAAYGELSRVLRPGGVLVVTDFHPSAARAGHARTFRDAQGSCFAVEHHVHEVEEHLRHGSACGLEPVARLEPCVDEPVRPWYERAGALDRYERDRGLPLVLALAFRR
jgi:malonyl-CoA O-methyltransferase